MKALNAVLLAALAWTNAGADNVVTNGGLEHGAAGVAAEVGLPAGWVHGFGDLSVLETMPDPRPGSAGAQSLKIHTREGMPHGGVKSDFTPLDPQKPLKVLCYVRDGGNMQTNVGPRVAVAWFDSERQPAKLPGRATHYTYIRVDKKPGWQGLSRTFTPLSPGGTTSWGIPATAALFQVWVFVQTYRGPVWLDDVVATQVLEPPRGSRLVLSAEASAVTAQPEFDWTVNWLGGETDDHRFSVRFAADELAASLSRMLGQPVPAVPWPRTGRKATFLITGAEYAPPSIAERLAGKRRDAFVIRYPCVVDGRTVCLMVVNDRYGYDQPVYYFLPRYANVHRLGPGPLGEVVPSDPDWSLPEQIDVFQNPDLEMRFLNVLGFDARPWLAKNHRFDFHHALSKVFPPSVYGEDHPELYPLVEGRRYVPDAKIRHRVLSGWQPCVGNPEAVGIAARYGSDLMSRPSNLMSFSLSVNDGRGNQCECPRCWAMDSETAFDQLEPDYSDRYFRFYNAVLERVLKKSPDAYLAVLGYGNSTTRPPHETRIHPRTIVFDVDGVDPIWWSMGATPAVYQNLMDTHFVTLRHMPHRHALMYRKLKRYGGIGSYASIHTVWAAHAANYYVLARLMWDADSDVDALLDEFLRLAYGAAAAPHMRVFFDRWEDIFERDHGQVPDHAKENVFTRNWHTHPPDYLTREDYAVMDQALERAAACRMAEEERKRFDLCAAYYRLVRVVGGQYLTARELSDRDWVMQQGTDVLLDTLERALDLPGQFDRIAEEQIYGDTTGWLVPKVRGRDPKRHLGSTAGIRQIVATLLETAMDDAVTAWADLLAERDGDEKAIAELEAQAGKRPALLPFIGPQINRLKGIDEENLVRNPSFEEALPGRTDRIGYWSYSPGPERATGMAPCRYTWEDGTGHTGPRSAGIGGPSLYAGVSTGVAVEPGHRYRFSFWYKTVGRKYTCSINLSMKAPRITFYVPPTYGEWRKVTRTFTVKEGDHLSLLLRSGWQYRRLWTYFDDVEIVKIW